MKKYILNPWSALVTLSIMLLIRVWDPGFEESVRLRYFDQLIISNPTKDVPIHVVNIDEAALDKFGQFPFPRGVYGNIIEDLFKRNAGLVVFNVMMPESDRFKQDKELSSVLAKYPVILPQVAGTKNKNSTHNSSVQVIGELDDQFVEYPGIISNISILEEHAAGMGVVNTFPEIDGVVRRMPLLIMSDGRVFPAVSLETLRVATGDTRIQVKVNDTGIAGLRVPKFGKIGTDNLSRIWIDWSQKPFEYSLVDLPKDFHGGIVIVGLSAAGLNQPIATARGEIWPQYLQGSLIGTIINGNIIQRPEYSDLLEIGSFIILSLILISLMRWTYIGIASTLIVMIASIMGSIFAYKNFLFLFDITFFVLGILFVALHAYMAKFVSEFLQKQQIRKQFQSYLSPDLVAKLIKDPSLLKLGGEEKELSIMFTDVRGFTSISEHYGKNVQGLTKIMNRYMTAMTRKILENDGTLDKYIGDAQMAFWNAPLDETQHCKDAVKAALEMLRELDGFNDEVSKEGVPPFGMGIGINTGVVVVGNMGSEQRFDYTCLGDAVNLASRLEGQSKNYGVIIVLGPTTAQRLGDEYFTLELDCIAVKGKKEGVNIFTVFYNPDQPETLIKWKKDRELHNLMLNYYRKQEWENCLGLVELLKGKFNGQMDNYYRIWIDRVKEMSSMNLPENWDGTYHAQSK